MPESSAASTTRDDINTPSPPIFELDNDILWCIFSFNADMELKSETEIPALLTLRYTSQVCSSWRVLVTGSPLLWARVLNINSLLQKGEQWRREVVLRTGTAPLHIRWKDNFYTGPLRVDAILRQTVKANWTRVQSLYIEFGNSRQHEPEKWLAIFQCPAPSLQIFRFYWPPQIGDLSEANFILFSSNAPLLRQLSACNIKLNLATLPISNIVSLTLHSSILAFELLQFLPEMKLLSTFTIRSSRSFVQPEGGNACTLLPRVVVPRLTTISISESRGTNDSLSFLRQIIPAKGCVLSLYSNFSGQWSNDISLGLCHDILTTYSTYCTELASTINLCVTFRERFLNFSSSLPSSRNFLFAVDNYLGKFPNHALPTLLPSFTNIQLDKLRKLEIHASFTQPQLSDPQVVKFILALDSVKILITDGETFHALTVMQSNTNVVILPALESIEVTYEADLAFARDFLKSRTALRTSEVTITLTKKPSGFCLALLGEVQV